MENKDESFKWSAGNPKEQEKEPEKPKANAVHFTASIEGLASLKDGGVVLRLGLPSTEYVNFAKLLMARNENKILDIFAQIKEPEKYGGNL